MHTQLRTLLRQTSALTSIAAIGVLFAQPVLANPLGGDVVSGAATISTPDPSTTLINQSTDRAVINWDSFDIGVGELTQFDLPSADSWTLNRVVGSQNPSSIQGTITSNGNIVIVNPDGIHFGPGSTVDVNRLIASTADITNDNFMAGQLDFGIAGNPSASIVNEGVISAADYGLAALVAPSVRNSGVIMARLGTVGLSAGNSFTIDPYGDGLIKLAIGDEIAGEVFDVATGEAVSDLVSNDGTLSADGGTVAMTAATARQAVNSVVNNTGIVEARSVGMQNGMIVLGGSTAATKPAEAPAQVVRVSGTIDASGTNELYPLGTPVTGGAIEVTGEAIIASGATIDASGTNGGGTVLIGGDYLGGNIAAQEALALGVELEDREIETATSVGLSNDVTITADALKVGDGGKIIVWSDGTTRTSASIAARGGTEVGDGGFIETSGGFLDLRRSADASATNGVVGTWLIDPFDIRIDDFSNGLQEQVFSPNSVSFFPSSEESVLDVSVIEAALNSGSTIVITTDLAPGSGSGNITLSTDIMKSAGGDALLLLRAAGDIIVDRGVDITSNSGALGIGLASLDGSISANDMGEIDLNGGVLSLLVAGDITLSSNFDMPNVAIEVLPNGGSSRDVAIQFDDDQIAFRFNNETIEVDPGGISLTDTSADGWLRINDDGSLNLLLSNLSLVDRFGRFLLIDADGSIGVLPGDALDGVPEIVFGVDQFDLDGASNNGQNYLYTPGPEYADNTPVAEISTDFNETVDVYEVSAPSGIPILEAYLDSLTAPVEPPEVVVEPTDEQGFLNPDLFLSPTYYLDDLINASAAGEGGMCRMEDAQCFYQEPAPTEVTDVNTGYVNAPVFSSMAGANQAVQQLVATRFQGFETSDGFLYPTSNYPVSLRKECVSLVRAFDTSLSATPTWEEGPDIVPDVRGNYPDIAPGTPLATFRPDGTYPGSTGFLSTGQIAHTGIFVGYESNASGEIVGMYLFDQYSVSGGKAPSVTFYGFSSSSRQYQDGRNYSIVQ